MTTIVVNDKYKIVFDGYNWEPHIWKESSLIENGKYKGQMSKAGWKACDKYFPKLCRAVQWIITDGLSGEDLTLESYIAAYRAEVDRIEAVIQEAMKVSTDE